MKGQGKTDSKTSKAEIGIIGGSGLYQMEELTNVKAVDVTTPFGKPSGKFVIGKLNGMSVAFLPRHGVGHRITPSEINYRANIYAFKKLGVSAILSVGAVGSMKKEIVPGHIVVPDQFYDLTKGRKSTFFGNGIVAHVSLADPICSVLAATIAKAAKGLGAVVHKGGTYLCMEGPQFSSRAESEVHRKWNVSVIGMTHATEAKLAREAEICYATLALSTDYDCWHVSEEPVTSEMVIKVLLANVALSRKIIESAVGQIPGSRGCRCGSALKNAIVTDFALVPPKTRQDLSFLLDKYFPQKLKGKEKK
ncbi:MAG: S-methyl-5'-thioadenosine phosphorylase [Nitrospirota bacterium]